MTFTYYRHLLEEPAPDGCPRIPQSDPLIEALVREHGTAGRPDIAPEIALAPAIKAARALTAIATVTPSRSD